MRIALAMLATATLAAACSKNNEPPPPSSGSPMAQTESGPKGAPPAGSAAAAPSGGINEEAQSIFASVCATCHGTDGTGNGPAAASLTPKPRNYTDKAWQASVTDEELRTIIVQGGQAVGKSAMMPANAHLKDKPETLNGLVQIIRSFGKP